MFQKHIMPQKDPHSFPADLPPANKDTPGVEATSSKKKPLPKNSVSGKGKTIEPKASSSQTNKEDVSSIISDSEDEVMDLTHDFDNNEERGGNEGPPPKKKMTPSMKYKLEERQFMSTMTNYIQDKQEKKKKHNRMYMMIIFLHL